MCFFFQDKCILNNSTNTIVTKISTMMLPFVIDFFLFQNSTISIEEFHAQLQEATNFPLRPFVIPFLKVCFPLFIFNNQLSVNLYFSAAFTRTSVLSNKVYNSRSMQNFLHSVFLLLHKIMYN